MFEQEFFHMAISEGGRPLDGDYTPYNRAMHKISQGIGWDVSTKEDFMANGLHFLHSFEQIIKDEIFQEKDGNNDEELTGAFNTLLENSKQLNEYVFLKLLSEDWDDRLGAEYIEFTMEQAKRDFARGLLCGVCIVSQSSGGWSVQIATKLDGEGVGWLVDARKKKIRVMKTIEAAIVAVSQIGFVVNRLKVEYKHPSSTL